MEAIHTASSGVSVQDTHGLQVGLKMEAPVLRFLWMLYYMVLIDDVIGQK